MVCDAYPMNTDKQFVNPLEDNIRTRGDMDQLVSDSDKVEVSNKVHDVLRTLCIDSWQK